MSKPRMRPADELDIGRTAVLEDHDRMSRRLNAEVIHKLFAVGLKLQAVASQFNDDDPVRRQLEDTVFTADEAIHAVREMVFSGLTREVVAGL
jgi:signal transduction histidine kinase